MIDSSASRLRGIENPPFIQRKALVIDGHNLLFKAFSVPFQVKTEKGTPLQVVTTFVSSLRRAAKAVGLTKDDYFAIAFDVGGTNANKELYLEYKANRKYEYVEGADSPFLHLPYIQQTLEHLSLASLGIRGFEADDVIASLAKEFNQQDVETFILSSDTDFYQVLNEKTSILRLLPKNKTEIISATVIEERLGIKTSQYVLYKALIGDTADNIKGIKGVGPVAARKIVNEQIEFDKEAHKDMLERNLKLIEVDSNVAIPLSFEELKFNAELLTKTNREIFEEIGF